MSYFHAKKGHIQNSRKNFQNKKIPKKASLEFSKNKRALIKHKFLNETISYGETTLKQKIHMLEFSIIKLFNLNMKLTSR